MTDSGESKAVPERHKQEYERCKIFSDNPPRKRLVAIFEELGTAEAKVRELEAETQSLQNDLGNEQCEVLDLQVKVREQAQTIERLTKALKAYRHQHANDLACMEHFKNDTEEITDCRCWRCKLADAAFADADRRAASQKGAEPK